MSKYTDIPTPAEIRLLDRLNATQHAAVLSSEWVEGSGRRTRSLPVPPFSARVERFEYDRQPQRIRRVFDKHPRAQAVVAVVDRARASAFLNALRACGH